MPNSVRKVCPTCQRDQPAEATVCPHDGARLFVLNEAVDETSPVGELIDGRYRVEALIGLGGMGAVYRATNTRLGRPVALKLLRRDLAHDAGHVKRFLREVQAVSRLSHPHIITVHDFGQTDAGLLYIAMELLEGQTLQELLEERAHVPAARVLAIGSQICGALAAAHESGVVHRDLKPENVVLGRAAGESDYVKVLDFGVAKLDAEDAQPKLTQTGYVVGTPAYMSPEQIADKSVTAKADLYALGCVLYECLVGRPPFASRTLMELIAAHTKKDVPPLAEVWPLVEVPDGLEPLLRDLLEKHPACRPESALAVKERLDSIALKLTGGTADDVAPRESTPAADGGVTQRALKGQAVVPRVATGTKVVDPRALDPARTTTPGRPAPPTGSGEPAVEIEPEPTAAARPRRRWGLAVAAALGLVAAVIALLALRGGTAEPTPTTPPPRPAPDPSPRATQPAPPPPEVHRLWVRSEPSGAKVWDEAGTALGPTPVEVELPADGGLTLRLELTGYEPLVREVPASARGYVVLPLEPLPKRKRARRKKGKKRRGRTRDLIEKLK